MNNKTIGIILTVLTVFCCACPGFGLCITGGLVAAGQPISTEVNGVIGSQTLPPAVGILFMCFALILILIPFAVGFFTLRKKPEAAPVVSNMP